MKPLHRSKHTSKRPLLFDVYSGAGGAAMGYYDAGFRVIGVDNNPKPLRHYPFPFLCADALETLAKFTAGERLVFSDGHSYGMEDIAALHASPPCQFYSRLRHLPWLQDKVYWRSIPPSRAALQATGKPYVLENVEDAAWDMVTPTIICGYSLGLPLFRHRCFETQPFSLLAPGHRRHDRVIVSGGVSLSQRHHGEQGFKGINRSSIAGHDNFQGDTARRRVTTGIDWMAGSELAQAIPPAYTLYIGSMLMVYLGYESMRSS